MKKSTRTVFSIALLSGLLLGCRKPAATNVSGTYSLHDSHGSEYVLRLDPNGRYERVLSAVEGKAVTARTNETGTWTFDPTQSLVFLTNIYLETFAYAFNERGTQTSLLRTSTPAILIPKSTYRIGTNITEARLLSDTQPFYRSTSK
jgi:hypothetical protein